MHAYVMKKRTLIPSIDVYSHLPFAEETHSSCLPPAERNTEVEAETETEAPKSQTEAV